MPYYSTIKILEQVLLNGVRNKYLYNSHRSFKFKNNKFYSYNTVIAEYLDDSEFVYVYPKTAKYGEFISMTTSKQVNWLISYLRKYNIPHNLDKDSGINYNVEEVNFKEEDGHECPITYQIITAGLKTKCGHIFEKVALKQWLRSKNQCPMCRTIL